MSIELDTINEIIGNSKKSQKADNKPKKPLNSKKQPFAADKEAKSFKKKPGRPPKAQKKTSILSDEVSYPLWVSVSEAAKFGGVTTKTIRRALQDQKIKFKIVQNRYHLDLRSTIKFLYTSKKLENKLKTQGIGQYIVKWKE
jgi:hypothetical protein